MLSDKYMSLRFMPIKMTEVIVPRSRILELMDALKVLYDTGLAPAPMTPVLVDSLPGSSSWLGKNGCLAEDAYYITVVASLAETGPTLDGAARVFEPVWDLARRVVPEHRLHWGKTMDPRLGPADMRAMFRGAGDSDNWARFAELRRRMDPEGRFLNANFRRLFEA